MRTSKTRAEEYIRLRIPELQGVDSGRPEGGGYIDYPSVHLQHWLQMIAWGVKYQSWKEPNINFSGATALRIGAGTPDSIIFSLLTGQPATEADYQTFCNLAGL